MSKLTRPQPPHPTPLEVQYAILSLMIPMGGSKPKGVVGADTVILNVIDSLEAVELIMGLEDLFPTFDSDAMDIQSFGPSVWDAAVAVSKSMSAAK